MDADILGRRRVFAVSDNALARAPTLSATFPGVESGQLQQYIPVVMLGVLAIAFSAGMLILSVVLGKAARRSSTKDTPYECGMVPVGEGTARLSVKFYLVAMLFIIFDIEVVFLYPWAVIYRDMIQEHAGLILGGMIPFLLFLAVGYIYEVKKRAFDWKS